MFVCIVCMCCVDGDLHKTPHGRRNTQYVDYRMRRDRRFRRAAAGLFLTAQRNHLKFVRSLLCAATPPRLPFNCTACCIRSINALCNTAAHSRRGQGVQVPQPPALYGGSRLLVAKRCTLFSSPKSNGHCKMAGIVGCQAAWSQFDWNDCFQERSVPRLSPRSKCTF